MELNDNQDTSQYYAFISYSHKDVKYAKSLQKRIENYGLPTTLNGRPTHFPKQLRPIFRDDSDLGCGYLTDEILSALNRSKFLIVVCSKTSRESKWCNWEIEEFSKTHQYNKIIPVILEDNKLGDGINNYCPPALSSLNDNNELIAINAKVIGYELAITKIIAYMLGIGVEELWRRDKRRLRIRFISISILLLTLLIVTIVIALSFRKKNIEINYRDTTIIENNRQISYQRDSIAQLANETRLENINFKIEKANRLSQDNHPIEALMYLNNVLFNYSDIINNRYKELIAVLFRNIYHSVPRNIEIGSVELIDTLVSKTINSDGLSSRDKTIIANIGAGTLDIIDYKTNEIVFSIGNEDCALFDTYSSAGILDINCTNQFVLARGATRNKSALSLTDIENNKVHILSSWNTFDIEDNSTYFNDGQFVADGNQLMLYGSAGMIILHLPSMKTKASLKDEFDICLYNDSDDSFDAISNKLKVKINFSFTPNRKDLLFQIKCAKIIWDVSVCKTLVAIATEEGIEIWDIKEKRKQYEFLTDYSLHNLQLNHAGNMIVANTAAGDVYLCSSDGEIIDYIDFPAFSNATMDQFNFLFSPNDDYLFIHNDGHYVIYNVCENTIVHRSDSVTDYINYVNDNSNLFSNNNDNFKKTIDYTSIANIDNFRGGRLERLYSIIDEKSSIQYVVYPDNVIDVIDLCHSKYNFVRHLCDIDEN